MIITLGNFFFKYRTVVFPLCLPLALIPAPSLFGDPAVAAAIGFVIALAGECVRSTAIGMQYIVRGGRNRRVYARDLVTGGLYAHTRNPMYVGNVLILAGLAIASNSWLALGLLLPLYLFVCVCIVAAEEVYLRGRFGEAFDEYCRDVPRWIPRLSGIGETLADHEFNWRRLVIKEYGTLLGWTWTWGALYLWNLWRGAGGTAAHPTEVGCIVAVMATTLAAWIAARVIKKAKLWKAV